MQKEVEEYIGALEKTSCNLSRNHVRLPLACLPSGKYLTQNAVDRRRIVARLLVPLWSPSEQEKESALVSAIFLSIATTVPELASFPRMETLTLPGTWTTAVIGVCLLAVSFLSRRR